MAGLQERTRLLGVSLAAAGEPGHRVEEISLRYNDEAPPPYRLPWEVVAPLRIRPSGLIMSAAGKSEQEVAIDSQVNLPFRLIGVRSSLMQIVPGSFDRISRTSHNVTFRVDASSGSRGLSGDVVFETDLESQRFIKLPVYISGRQ